MTDGKSENASSGRGYKSERMDIEHLWTEYRAGLKAFLGSRVSNAADVEDLLQEIMVRTHGSLDTIRSHDSVRSFLMQVAHHAIIDFYRKNGKKRPSDTDIEEAWYAEPDEETEHALLRCVAPFIAALPDPESAALLRAVDLDGRSQKEYANELGVSYTTLKSRVQKARKELAGIVKNCCQLSMDGRGKVMGYESRSGKCNVC